MIRVRIGRLHYKPQMLGCIETNSETRYQGMNLAGACADHHAGPACTEIPPTRHVPDLREDVRSGLLEPPRSLPPKYFYDDLGARLFERICETDEYYPTRTEDALLALHAEEIIGASRPAQILEFGSGSSKKTRRLFAACESLAIMCRYLPFDVCEPALLEAAMLLQSEYDWLDVQPLLGDYHAGLDNLPTTDGVDLYVFLGGTIGNFEPSEAENFVEEVRACMDNGDYFLLGADRIKGSPVLDAAYNDEQGITAAFNLNLLNVLNRHLRANFDPDDFYHKAVFDEARSRIEMYLVSHRNQNIDLIGLDETLALQSGEHILTEVSYKFEKPQLEKLLTQRSFTIVRHFEPDNEYFSLLLARAT